MQETPLETLKCAFYNLETMRELNLLSSGVLHMRPSTRSLVWSARVYADLAIVSLGRIGDLLQARLRI